MIITITNTDFPLPLYSVGSEQPDVFHVAESDEMGTIASFVLQGRLWLVWVIFTDRRGSLQEARVRGHASTPLYTVGETKTATAISNRLPEATTVSGACPTYTRRGPS